MRSRLFLVITLLVAAPSWAERVAAAEAVDDEKALVLRGTCLLFQGLLHAELPFVLYQPSQGQASLVIDCPPLSTLPERLLFLKDGDALLHWVEPASARDPLDSGNGILELLGKVPAERWIQFLLAEDLWTLIDAGKGEDTVGASPLTGSLGGSAAHLKKLGKGLWSMCLIMDGESYRLTWRRLPEARRCLLYVETPSGRRLMIRSRFPRRRSVDPEEWLFIRESEEILEPAEDSSVGESFQSGGK